MAPHSFHKGSHNLTHEERAYVLRYLALHLAEADEREQLRSLLSDFEFMEAKASALGPLPLIADYELSDDQNLRLIRGALRRAAHILESEPEILPSHLYNTLFLEGVDGLADQLLTRASRVLVKRPWIRLINRPEVGMEHQGLIRVLEHGAAILATSWSPDHRTIATSGGDNSICLWDLPNGELKHELAGHTASISALAWSPNSPLLASGDDNMVRLWDTTTGRLRFSLAGHSDDIQDLAWSHDGRLLASEGTWDDHTILVWDANSGQSSAILENARGPKWSPSSDLLALASSAEENTVRVWDASSGQYRAILIDTIALFAWSPDGQTLAVGSKENSIWLWDALSGKVRKIELAHTENVSALSWSRDSKWLASGSQDGVLKIWDRATAVARIAMKGHWDDEPLKTGKKEVSRVNPNTGMWANRDLPAEIESISWSPGEKLVASVGKDETVRIWDTARREARAVLRGQDSARLAWSPDGTLLAVGSKDNTVRLWEADTATIKSILTGHTSPVWFLSWSEDGAFLVSSSGDGTVRIWDPAVRNAGELKKGLTGQVEIQGFSPRGTFLSSTNQDSTGMVQLWETVINRLAGVLINRTVRKSSPTSMEWSPNEALLATADSIHYEGCVWNIATGELRFTLKGHSDLLNTLAWSPDGRWLATGSEDKTVRLWDMAIGNLTSTLEGHTDRINALAWSPDGKMLASAGSDSTVRLWDATTGRLKSTLKGHNGSVERVAWSPDGRLLASAQGVDRYLPMQSFDGSRSGRFSLLRISQGLDKNLAVRVWDVSTRECRVILPGAGYPLAWSPSGSLLVTRSYFDTVVLWEVSTAVPRFILEGHSPTLRRPKVLEAGDKKMITPRRYLNKKKQKVAFYLPSEDEYRLILGWSPDGALLATGGKDGSVRLWDIQTGANLATVYCLSPVRSIRFDSEGHFLQVADNGGATGNRPVSYIFELCNIKIAPLMTFPHRQSSEMKGEAQEPEQPDRSATQAEHICQQLLPILVEGFGANNSEVHQAIVDLAHVYESLHEYAQAELIYRQLVPILEDTLGTDDLELALMLHHLANLLLNQEKYAEAESLCRRTLEIAEKHNLGDSDRAPLLRNLGVVCAVQGKLAEAESLLRKAVAILEKGEKADQHFLEVCRQDLEVVRSALS